jgi:competence protein ComFC
MTTSFFSNGVKLLRKIYEFFLDILFPLDPEVHRLEKMSSGDLVNATRRLERGRELPESIILFEYKDPLIRTAIAEIKFRGNKKIARLIGEVLRDALLAELIELKTFENFSAPLLVSVPLTRRSLRARGWDQCHLMLGPLIDDAERLDIEIRFDALKKIRETGDQVGKNKKERLENLTGSLEALKSIIHKRNVIVFDDVVTTGATWIEAKRALCKADARKVILFAVAH